VNRRSRGQSGEEAAWAHLRRAGYALVERNYRSRYGEIDLVVEKDGVVVFVEVRSRKGNRFGTPFESVDRRKQLQIGRMANEYVARRRLADRRVRFDVVAVEWQDAGPGIDDVDDVKDVKTIDHLENAFDLTR
jgi:putative endonuclease